MHNRHLLGPFSTINQHKQRPQTNVPLIAEARRVKHRHTAKTVIVLIMVVVGY